MKTKSVLSVNPSKGFLFLFVFLFMFSCSKEKNSAIDPSSKIPENLLAVDDWKDFDYDQLGKIHNETLKYLMNYPGVGQLDQAELEQVLYQYGKKKYGIKEKDSEEMIQVLSAYDGLDMNETLEKMKQENLLTETQVEIFNQLIASLSALQDLALDTQIARIEALENQLRTRTDITWEQKAPILAFSSVFKYSSQFWEQLYGSDSSQNARSEDLPCKKLQCLLCYSSESNKERIKIADARAQGALIGTFIENNRFNLIVGGPLGAALASYRELVQTCPSCFEEFEAWYASASGYGNWELLITSCYKASELGFGDFTGDSRTDLFLVSEGNWLISDGGVGPWEQINTSGYPFHQLRFGDFVGDEKTDVFTSQAGQWYVSESGTGSWQELTSSGYPLSQLAFGDFLGDEKTDVFTAQAGRWYVSESGIKSWKKMAASSIPVQDLRFGDFIGDGRTDVFSSQNNIWYVSSGAVGSWTPINSSGYSIDDLVIGDFTGSDRSDVFTSQAGQWFISTSGTSEWEAAANSSVNPDELGFGDFVGNGKTDVFARRPDY